MNNRMNAVEKIRKDAMNTNLILIIIGAIGAAGFMLTQNYYVFLVVAVFIFFAVSVGSKKTAKFRYVFKDYNLRHPAESVFNQEVDVNWTGIDLEKVEDSHIVPFANQYTSENTVTINLDKVTIAQSIVTTELKYTNDGRNALIANLFHGRYTVISFPVRISSYLSIRDEKIAGTNLEKHFDKAPETTKIETIDSSFNKLFDVYAEDVEEAQKLLTTELLAILKSFKESYQGIVYLGFLNNECHIAISQGEAEKDPSIYRSVVSISYDEKKQEYENMKKIVEYFEKHGK